MDRECLESSSHLVSTFITLYYSNHILFSFRCRWYQHEGRKCPVRLKVSHGGEYLRNTARHNHENDQQHLIETRLRATVKRRVELESGAFHRIFVEELPRCVTHYSIAFFRNMYISLYLGMQNDASDIQTNC